VHGSKAGADRRSGAERRVGISVTSLPRASTIACWRA
jgi:hypothetical protein